MKLEVFPDYLLVPFYNKYFNKITNVMEKALVLSLVIKYKKS